MRNIQLIFYILVAALVANAQTYINNQGNHITYYYYANADDELVPWHYLGVTPVPNYLAPWNDFSCPSNLTPPGGGHDEEALRGMMAEAEQQADSTQTLINMLKDAGDTEALHWDVSMSAPWQSMEVYSELMSVSPYVSDTVLASAIEQEDVLVDAMIRDILVDNPHSVKSDDLLLLLENRINQLPEYMLAQIDQGYNLMSAKEELESTIAANELMAALLSNTLIRLHKADTVNPAAAFDSLTTFLAQRQTPGSYYRLAFEYLDAGQVNEAAATILSIGSFNLSDKQFEVYNRMITYFDLLKNIRMQDRNIYELQTEEVDVLTGLANGKDMVSAYARSILIANNLLVYHEEIILPAAGIKSSRIKRNAAIPESKLSVYPNPATNYFILSYNTGNAGNTSNKLVISDLTGRMVKSIELGKHPSDQQIIPLQGVNKGVYICTLVSNRQIISNTKLVVQ